MENLIILGTGCAGLTAAVYAARANLKPLVIEGNQPGGQLTTTSEIENFPGFPDGIDGWLLTENIRKQAAKFGSTFASDYIEKAALSDTSKKLFSNKKTYEARAVIIATGAAPRLLGIPGEREFFGGNGVTTCATCDGAFYREMDVAVIGCGDSACEEALFLTHFASKVTLIHRRDAFRASEIMVRRVLSHPKIETVLDSVPEEILGDENGKVRAVRVKNLKSGTASEIACKGVFIAVGHIPNTKPFADAVALDPAGYVISSKPSGVHTNIAGVFAAGDCADSVYQQAITAAAMGCRAAIEAERWLNS